MVKENLYTFEKIHRKETVMKKVYEKPAAEEMLVLSENVMTASGEEVDEETNDNERLIDMLIPR